MRKLAVLLALALVAGQALGQGATVPVSQATVRVNGANNVPVPSNGAIPYGLGSWWSLLTPSTDGKVLTLSGGLPSWQTPVVTVPAGSATELQYRSGASTFGAVSGSAVTPATGAIGLTAQAATTVPLTIKAAANQSASLVQFKNSADVVTTEFAVFPTQCLGIGKEALLGQGASPSSNTALGDYALSNFSGSYNTAVGSSAASYAPGGVGGNQNTAVGNVALYGSTGSYNTAVGKDALREGAGSYATGIGYGAGHASFVYSNITLIGAYADATAANQVVLSDGSAKGLSVLRATSSNGQVSWGTPAASPQAYTHTLSATPRAATDVDVAGANATLVAGPGTGTAAGGSLLLQVAPKTTASSSTLGTPQTVATFAPTATTITVPTPVATTGASQAGNSVSITASPAVASTDTAGAAAGGNVTITAGAAARYTSGNANGGDVVLATGAPIGTGRHGLVKVASDVFLGSAADMWAGGSAKKLVLSDGTGIYGGANLQTWTAGGGYGTEVGYIESVYAGLFVADTATNAAGFSAFAFYSAALPMVISNSYALMLTNMAQTRYGYLYPDATYSLTIGSPPSATPAANRLVVGEASRGGTDSNVSGASGTITSPPGTGNSTPSALILASPDIGVSGTTQQTVTEKARIDGNGFTVRRSLQIPLTGTGTIQYGSVVAIDASTDGRFAANGSSATTAIGVIGGYANSHVNTESPIVIQGIGHVLPATGQAVTRGHFLCQSSTAGVVDDSATLCTAGLGIAKALYSEATNVIVSATASSNVIVLTSAPGWAIGDPVVYYEAGGAAIAGLTTATVYWIKTINTTSVTLAATKGGATEVDITADGTCTTQYLMRLPLAVVNIQ